jgi:alpha-tubulin suppressor-like RCC1 family protein
MRKRFILAIVVVLLVLATVLVVTLFSMEEDRFVIGKPLPPGPVQPQLHVSYNGEAVFLAPDGSVWHWGGNPSMGGVIMSPAGRQGMEEFPQRLGTDHHWRAVAMSSGAVVALKNDGTLWQWSNQGWPAGAGIPARPATQIGTDNDWLDVSGMVSHFMALKKDGTLWGWGQNESGQIGNGEGTVDPNTSSGGLGVSFRGPNSRMNTPVMVGTNHDWKAIAAGAFNSYALKQDGTFWGWGSGLGYQKKTNDVVPKQLDPGTNWVSISVGDYHVVALKSDGTLWLRGQNASLAARDYAPSRAGETLFQLGTDTDWTATISGQNCFFARKKDGSWWVCGDNTNGKLGADQLMQIVRPPQAGAAPSRGPQTGRRGGGATTRTYGGFSWTQAGSLQRLGRDFEPWAFGAGGETTLLLTKDGNLWTWGTRLGAKPSPFAAKGGIRGVYQSSVAWIKEVLRPKSNQKQMTSSPTSGDVKIDPAPHKLWSLPAEVRQGLGTNAATNSSH